MRGSNAYATPGRPRAQHGGSPGPSEQRHAASDLVPDCDLLPGPPLRPQTSKALRCPQPLFHCDLLRGKLCFLLPSGTSAGAALKLCHVETAQHSPGPRSPPPCSLGSGWRAAERGVRRVSQCHPTGRTRRGARCPPDQRAKGPAPAREPVEPPRAAGKGRSLTQSAESVPVAHVCESVR